MQTQVKVWGNSQGIRIPKEILQRANISLNEVLDIESSIEEESLTVVIVKKGDKLAGLVVDKLIGQQEIVIKSLGKYINNSSKIIGGATILGDGEVALILDVNPLL